DRPLDHGSEVELGEAALLPNTYVPDVHMRLVLYKRIASASSVEQLKNLQIELIDRFGLLPDAAKNLFASTELKLYCAGLGIVKIAAHQDGGRIVFDKEPKIDVTALLSLLQKEPSVFKLVGNEKLYFTLELDTVDKRIDYVLQLINNIAIREAA
ncbi:transcription-repair coupling factor, partial [Gammaproteobacteria bacterium]|nr:transcription-repair coupling factor [Gammaproteobacteria bacterium]